MKKLLKPEMEFIKFNTEDVITTSGGKINLEDKSDTVPETGAPATQTDWSTPTFNK